MASKPAFPEPGWLEGAYAEMLDRDRRWAAAERKRRKSPAYIVTQQQKDAIESLLKPDDAPKKPVE